MPPRLCSAPENETNLFLACEAQDRFDMGRSVDAENEGLFTLHHGEESFEVSPAGGHQAGPVLVECSAVSREGSGVFEELSQLSEPGRERRASEVCRKGHTLVDYGLGLGYSGEVDPSRLAAETATTWLDYGRGDSSSSSDWDRRS
jgi:hypothetical protein